MQRYSFRKDGKKRILCLKCNGYLVTAFFNVKTKTSSFTRATDHTCKGCGTNWKISAPGYATQNNREGVSITLTSNDGVEQAYFTSTSRVPVIEKLDNNTGTDTITLELEEIQNTEVD